MLGSAAAGYLAAMTILAATLVAPPQEVRAAEPGLAPESPSPLGFHDRRDASYGEAIARYRAIEAAGGWPTLPGEPAYGPGDTSSRIPVLRQRLRIEGDLPPDADVDSPHFDQEVEEAVKRAQHRYGVREDGIVDERTRAALNIPVEARIAQLERDREQWREVPADIGGRSVLVNIPAYTLEAVDGDRVVLESRVIVGRPERPTPLLSGRINTLAFAPFWNVPPGIEAEDLLPEVQADLGELERRNIRVLTRGDTVREVDPTTVDWDRFPAAPFPYRFRQDPGGDNPMGRVKIYFPNGRHIFLHDTPEPHMFDFRKRGHSSGCIRVEHSLELAEFVLAGTPGWDRARIDAAAAGEREVWTNVSAPVPIHLLYLTSWMDDEGLVHFHPDIYGPAGI